MEKSVSEHVQKISERLGRDAAPHFPQLNCDPWVASSLLQKSIRRGDLEIAQKAAFTYFVQKGSAIWRRFMVIAYEDVGVSSLDAVTLTVTAATDPGWRKANGGNEHVVAQVARVLAEAPKSRSAEHLITSAQHHPSLARSRLLRAAGELADHLHAVTDPKFSLTERALAAWYASGIGRVAETRAKCDLPALLQEFRSSGVPDELMTATGIAAQKTREPITLMVPLIWLAANVQSDSTIIKSEAPHSKVVGGVPMYALDKHTRLGREAIRRFAVESDEVRTALARHVPTASRSNASYMAAFYADAAPLAAKLHWAGADALEELVTETDLLMSGVPREGFGPLLEALRNNLGHLDEVRARVFALQQSAAPGVGLVSAAG